MRYTGWRFFGHKDCFRHAKPFSFQGGHGQAIDVHENPGTVQFIFHFVLFCCFVAAVVGVVVVLFQFCICLMILFFVMDKGEGARSVVTY